MPRRIDVLYWRLQRRRHTRSAVRGLTHHVARLKAGASVRGLQPRLLVVPDIGPKFGKWDIGRGGIVFEAWQSAVELLGPDRVVLFNVREDESESQWHQRFLDTLLDEKITHILAQIEEDPDRREPWSWDVLAAALAHNWDGAFIGFMYDSAHAWLRLRARRMGRLMPNFMIADLCVPVAGVVRRGRYEVGPLTMPMSNASIAAIDAYVAGRAKQFDVTFIGALYDYRVELLDTLCAHGIAVTVNPHRMTPASNYLESRTDQPSYLDYMAGLAESELTLNFSLASGGPHEQYKIRVQEAAIVGCICLTDDLDRTRHFFAPNEYSSFSDPASLATVISERLADTTALRRDQQAARERARLLAQFDFWGRIEDGLHRRDLPALTGLSAPAEP